MEGKVICPNCNHCFTDVSMEEMLVKNRLYNIWAGMKQRCDNLKHKDYKYYGGRGISYSSDWKDFKNFYRDMLSGHGFDLSLDRINTDGNYCKENCRWATKKEQMSNRVFRFTANYNNYKRIDWGRVKKFEDLRKRGFTLQKIGDRYGITRERVRQVLGLTYKSVNREIHRS